MFISYLFNASHGPAPLLLYLPSLWAVVHHSALHADASSTIRDSVSSSWPICMGATIFLGLFLKILFIFNWESLLIVYKSCFSITFAWTMSLFYMSWIEGDLFIQPTEKHFLYISHAFLFCLEVEKWLLLRRTDLMNCFFLWLGLHHSFLFLKDHRQPSLVQKAGYNAFKHCSRLYLQLSVSLIKQVFC